MPKVPQVRAQEGDEVAEEAARRLRRRWQQQQPVGVAGDVDRVLRRLFRVFGLGGRFGRQWIAQSEAAGHRDGR